MFLMRESSRVWLAVPKRKDPRDVRTAGAGRLQAPSKEWSSGSKSRQRALRETEPTKVRIQPPPLRCSAFIWGCAEQPTKFLCPHPPLLSPNRNNSSL